MRVSKGSFLENGTEDVERAPQGTLLYVGLWVNTTPRRVHLPVAWALFRGYEVTASLPSIASTFLSIPPWNDEIFNILFILSVEMKFAIRLV